MTSESESESISTSNSESDSTAISKLSLVHESESLFKFGRRFALIFGNNGYRRQPLKSCHKDARDMAKVLARLGFICIVVLDAIKKHMKIEINAICKEIKEDDCLLLYFSGHGEERKGDNYLISIESDSNAKDNATSLNSVQKKLNECKNTLNIIILDACRGDKENKTFQNKAMNRSIQSVQKGRSTSTTDSRQVKPNLALIFSCDPGCYSYDGGNSESNSTFTGVLLNHLSGKVLALDAVMRRVTSKMLEISKEQQRPWMNSCLPKIFDFNNGSEPWVRTPQLDFNRLKKASLKFHISSGSAPMAANDKYLLYCPAGQLCLVNSIGKQESMRKRHFFVQDICWSSYRNRFLILDTDNYLYSFRTDLCRKIKFRNETFSLTCHKKRLLVTTDEAIEEYEMKQWKLVKTFQDDESTHVIRFDSSGTYLGIILCEDTSEKDYRFQLRYSLDMTVLRNISLGTSPAKLLSLPNRQFLISFPTDNKLRVFDPNDLSEQDIHYEKVICSVALLGNGERLIIQTKEPERLRFHRLIPRST